MNKLYCNKNKINLLKKNKEKISSFRNEIISMEHPFFSLKSGNMKIKEYINGSIKIIIRPTFGIGLATMFDKDIWIYAISKLQKSINNNKIINRKVCFTPYDFFLKTNRSKSGKSYTNLKKTLRRLKGTTVEININYYKGNINIENFSLIDNWRMIGKKKNKYDTRIVEVTLPEWLLKSLNKKNILKINSNYFKIKKPIYRRIYEIARKHCGKQKKFLISLEKLHLKTGSNSLLKMFRYNIKKLSNLNNLPDYLIKYNNSSDSIIFLNR